MKNEAPTTCPSLGALLAANESGPDAALAAAGHLDRCAACREEVRRAEQVLSVHRGLVARRSRTQIALGRERLCRELLEGRPAPATPSRVLRRLSAAAVVVLIAGSMFVHDGRLRAEELLARAKAGEGRQAPDPLRRVRVRLAPTAGMRDAALAPFTSWTGVLGVDELPPAVQQLLDRYGAARPLAVETYRAWRRSLSRRREIVSTREDRMVLRTWTLTVTDILRGAELTVRGDVPARVTLIGAGFRVELEPFWPSDALPADPIPERIDKSRNRNPDGLRPSDRTSNSR